MSKITFRADDDLVDRVESLDGSKSEVMREALRSYLDRQGDDPASDDRASPLGSLDDLVGERVDALVDAKLDESTGRDVNVHVTLETGDGVRRSRAATDRGQRRARAGRPGDEGGRGDGEPDAAGGPGASDAAGAGSALAERGEAGRCGRCGEALSDAHVYCPNCGEKASRRVFCECGDELRSDWAYCPGCGRRTPSAELLEG